MFDLSGKLAFVTGGHKGIGKAIALGFAQAGCDLIVHYFSDEHLARETEAQLRQAGRKVTMIQGDFTKSAEIRRVAAEALNAGEIDILVNNAGFVSYKPIFESDLELWEKVMSVNSTAPFVLTQQVAAQMAKAGRRGAILNITSVSAIAGTKYQVHYCASKGALLQLTRQTAVELASLGIRVNALAPGVIKTDANAALLNDPVLGKAYEQLVPLGYVGVPEDLVETALYLCSDSARYVTGQQLFVDGGFSVQASEPKFDKDQISRG